MAASGRRKIIQSGIAMKAASRNRIHSIACAALLLCGSSSLRAAEPDGVAFFESKIRPLLAERCSECHGEKKHKGGLRLDSKTAWEKGSDTGAVITPGKPETSLLVKAIRYMDAE